MKYKHCYVCNQDKPLSYFWKNKHARDGLATQCKDCIKRQRENPSFKSKMKSYLHDYFQRNKERNRDKNKARSNEWLRNNPDKRNAIRKTYYQTPNGHAVVISTNHKWRSRLSDSLGYYTAKQANELLKRCNHACLKCSSKKRIEFDHITPLSLGGCNCIGNLQPLCRKCNAAKGNRYIADYRPQEVIEWANSFPHNH